MTSDARFRFGVSIAAVLLLVAAVGWFVVATPGLCGNDNVSETPSPSGKWKLVVFERSCGATTGFYTHASVLKAAEKLGDEGGNLAIPERAWSAEWTGEDELTIEYSRVYSPAKKTERVGDVQIVYKQAP